ncbi:MULTISPECIES: DUF1206 domain-containing protein [unclassified Janibacter]|uniref:DUF1206 domain-containing protein n=1 Tax=unclassified Janibacter TaxID=2649294 RepID=UPI003D0136EA
MTGNEAQAAAREVGDHPVVEKGARLGFAVSGVMHLVIALLALQVAWGGGGASADQSGALGTLSQNPVGLLVLWVMVVGFLALGLWQVTEVVRDRSDDGAVTDRAKAAGKAVLYLALAWSSFRFASGGGSSSKDQTQDITATLMGAPFGRVLVGLVGLGVIAVGLYHVYKGWTEGFLDDLERNPGPWATRAGRVGYIAKGVALTVVGGLFGVAALQKQSSEASGLDGALRTLREQPFGPYLLSAVALGLAAYGLYSFARARHADL